MSIMSGNPNKNAFHCYFIIITVHYYLKYKMIQLSYWNKSTDEFEEKNLYYVMKFIYNTFYFSELINIVG